VVGAHWAMVDQHMASLLAGHGKLLFTWTVNEVGLGPMPPHRILAFPPALHITASS
jgi:hypothetical protein